MPVPLQASRASPYPGGGPESDPSGGADRGARRGAPIMTETKMKQGCPNWAKFLMVASLTINLVVVGLVVGQRIQATDTPVADPIMYLIPADKHPAAQEVVSRHSIQMANLREERQSGRIQMIDVIRAEEFQAAELASQLQSDRDISLRRRELQHEQMVELFNLLSYEERLRAADKLTNQISPR